MDAQQITLEDIKKDKEDAIKRDKAIRDCHKELAELQRLKENHIPKTPNPFIYLPIPVDDRVPKGYRLIVAYAKEDNVVIPIDVRELGNDNLHACDWEGCSSVEHVVRFSIKHKYETDLIANGKGDKE